MNVGRRKTRRSQAGFSLLEAMIAAVVLGIGLIGLAKLHISSIRGTVTAEELGRGAEVARELADTFATLDWNSLPACGNPTVPPSWVNPPNATGGCRAAMGPTQAMNPELGPGCTAWYTGDGVPDVADIAWSADPMNGDGSAPDTGNYRVDLRVSAHPGVGPNFPAAAAGQNTAVAAIWVWVCWRDSDNNVNEIGTTKVVPQNL